MASEQTKAAAVRFYETLNRAISAREFGLLDAVVERDAVDHNPDPGMKPGLEGIKEAFAGLARALPDLRYSVEDVIAEGDKAACRFSTRGTHRGNMMGVEGTGRLLLLTGIDILRFRDGKLLERWGEIDLLGLLQQLGKIPTPLV